MDIYEKKNPGRLVFSVIFAIIAAILIATAFTVPVKQYQLTLIMICAFAFIAVAIFFFFTYFTQHVILHVDEEGILTRYLFYLPWKYVDGFYINEVDEQEFLEIRLIDNEKYLSEMDPDLYSAYYDDMEIAHSHHGHELFFFPITYMGLSAEEALNFFTEAKKKYAKNK